MESGEGFVQPTKCVVATEWKNDDERLQHWKLGQPERPFGVKGYKSKEMSAIYGGRDYVHTHKHSNAESLDTLGLIKKVLDCHYLSHIIVPQEV